MTDDASLRHVFLISTERNSVNSRLQVLGGTNLGVNSMHFLMFFSVFWVFFWGVEFGIEGGGGESPQEIAGNNTVGERLYYDLKCMQIAE